MDAQHWITEAEGALAGAPAGNVDVIGTRSPPLLDAEGVKAVLAPLLAAFFWASAYFREQLSGNTMDPFALLLTLLALGMSFRTLLLGRAFLRRYAVYRRHADHGLAITPAGLLYRSPQGDVAVPIDDVVALRVHGGERQRGAHRRYREVYIVTRPETGRTHLAVPPVLGESPDWLLEQLERWRGVVEGPEGYSPPEAEPLPSKRYDAAAAGARAEGVTVIAHGNGWLRRIPSLTVLMGVALGSGFMRLPPDTRERIGMTAPFVILLALLAAPAMIYLLTRLDLAHRKGLSMVLTPAEILMRTAAGVHAVAYDKIEKLEVQSRTTWSLLWGQIESRALVIHRRGADYVSYVEAFLGTPAEVVGALIDAYRRGVLGGDSTER